MTAATTVVVASVVHVSGAHVAPFDRRAVRLMIERGVTTHVSVSRRYTLEATEDPERWALCREWYEGTPGGRRRRREARSVVAVTLSPVEEVEEPEDQPEVLPGQLELFPSEGLTP